jgi:hypothetical protein
MFRSKQTLLCTFILSFVMSHTFRRDFIVHLDLIEGCRSTAFERTVASCIQKNVPFDIRCEHLWLCCAEVPPSRYLWPLASGRHHCCRVSVPRAVVGFIDRHAPCWGVTMATSECFLPSGNHHHHHPSLPRTVH